MASGGGQGGEWPSSGRDDCFALGKVEFKVPLGNSLGERSSLWARRTGGKDVGVLKRQVISEVQGAGAYASWVGNPEQAEGQVTGSKEGLRSMGRKVNSLRTGGKVRAKIRRTEGQRSQRRVFSDCKYEQRTQFFQK